MMVPYVVRTGDYLRKLAARFGFDAEAVWNDPKNADLRAVRRSMDVLVSGDLLYLPAPDDVDRSRPVHQGATQSYQANVETIVVRQRILRNGKPLAGEPYVVAELPEIKNQSSDGDGWVILVIPTYLHQVTLDFTGRGVRFDLLVGHMDPENTRSGREMRLRHLGFLRTPPGKGTTPADVAQALGSFQSHYGLDDTGESNQATDDMLVKVHGS